MGNFSASWLWRRLGDLSLLQWCVSTFGGFALSALAWTENLPLSLIILIGLGAFAILVILFARTSQPSPAGHAQRVSLPKNTVQEVGVIGKAAIGPKPSASQMARSILLEGSANQGAGDLGYPYPKAILKPEITLPKGTRSANAGGEPHSMSIVMDVKADHSNMLANCYIELASLIYEGVVIVENEVLRAGKKDGKFTVGPSRSHRFTILNRDMRDPITPAPFMLHFVGKQQPLKEDADYVLNLRFRSPEYKWPILATVEIATGKELYASATVTEIGLPKDAYED